MKFELHKSIRYCDWTKNEWKKAVTEYLTYLNGINFYKAETMLKYFGHSFFHDGYINQVSIIPHKNVFIFYITREDDFEDINYFRVKKKLSKINLKTYRKNPIIYKCTFSGVKDIFANIDFSKYPIIMDTELIYKNNNIYLVNISFYKDKEISFICNNVKVNINRDIILKYTEGMLRNVPYCEECSFRLITKSKIKPYLEEIKLIS